ncbi:unnamed protein product [Echinostoma caproni]|uniref:mRNA cap guanine-N(7) methyltransferase n=1 Tax=Echinostoma caproni TaxID=27848 RepID=A0A183ARH5_9TREM|nr:unnamed protein product [Echinostoma caproni]
MQTAELLHQRKLEAQQTAVDTAATGESTQANADLTNAASVVKFYDSNARSASANSLAHRQQTRIYHLRNFNNWIKSVFINQYLEKLGRNRGAYVLDLCCGKGGDQLKWAQTDTRHVTFIDISSASIDVCRQRYEQLYRKRRSLYTADFHVADCTADLREKMRNQQGRFDLVSCQFSFHYAFESMKQARTFLANVSHSLHPGGYFIATIPNAYELVRRATKAYESSGQSPGIDGGSLDKIEFGNSIHTIRFPSSSYSVIKGDKQKGKTDSLQFPLFGSSYDFHLEGVVDCPEFLVYPPLLNHLAMEQNLIPVMAPMGFADFFAQHHSGYVGRESSRDLLVRMKALECYPNQVDNDGRHSNLVADGEPGAYDHVSKRIEQDEACRHSRYLGTLSLAEWEVITLYSLVAFQRK